MASDAKPRIRVALADDSYLVLAALVHVLEAADGIEVVARCGDLASLSAAVEADHPDVVVTDIRMPPSGTDEGLQMAERLRREHPEIGVVVLSQFAEPRYVVSLLDGGSDGRAYLLKDRVHYRGQLISAIEAVARGGSMIDPSVVGALITGRRGARGSPLDDLTPRELEILGYIARGYNNQGIADELVLTKRAVEKHVASILLKLDVVESLDVSRRVTAALIYLAETDPELKRGVS